MQSIFKKTLVAAAIAVTASANAATIVANGGATSAFTTKTWPLISAEGLAIAGSVDIGTTAGTDILVNLVLASAYQETDLLILTVAGATIDDASGISIGGSAFELLETTDTTITLRPIQSSGGVAAGTYALSGITLEGISGAVTLASRGVTVQGISIDTAAATTIATAASEFGIAAGTTVLNATVDVEKERKEFTGGLTDNFTVAVDSGADLLAVTAGVATLAVTGANLDFLNDADGDLDSASYALDSLTENTTKTTFVGNTLSVTSTGGYVSSFGMTFTADGVADADAQALEAQSFSADVSLAYTYGSTAGSVSASGLAVGSWNLSGATVNMPYMPYGAGITQVIYLSNDGSVVGDIELTAFDDAGNQYGPVMLSVSAAANSVTGLADAVRAALEEEGYDGSSKKFDITLVVNSPAADVDVYGAYNVRGDRVTVPVL